MDIVTSYLVMYFFSPTYHMLKSSFHDAVDISTRTCNVLFGKICLKMFDLMLRLLSFLVPLFSVQASLISSGNPSLLLQSEYSNVTLNGTSANKDAFLNAIVFNMTVPELGE